MIKLLSYNKIDTKEWQQLVDHSQVASFFQTKECYDFYISLSFLKPFVFGVSENDRLVGVLCGYIISDGNKIKRYFSRRAIVPGGALLYPMISKQALQMLLKKVVAELRNKVIYIELRNYSDHSTFRQVFENNGFSYQPHLNFHVSTPDVLTALKELNESKVRQLKISQKEGVEWHETTKEEDIKAFYACLKKLYKTKVKRPLFPLEFFEKLVATSFGKLIIVKHKDNVIGGMACVILPGKILYEWFVCGVDHKTKDIYPSVVATWAGIEFAAKNNIPHFDFMGAGKPDKNYGVREFKSKFGGELVEDGRFLYICHFRLYEIGKIVMKLLRKI